MKTTAVRLAIVAGLALAGWSVGRAQTQVAEFELTVTAPGGQTVIECRKGCDFQYDVGNTANLPKPNTRFQFACTTQTCAATINGHGHVMR
jgi:hypothetical protein